jgi:hypothetical protein
MHARSGRAGEAALLKRLDRLGFEHSKREVLDAIGKRKAQVSSGIVN